MDAFIEEIIYNKAKKLMNKENDYFSKKELFQILELTKKLT